MKIGAEEKAPSLKMTDFPKIIHQSWANENLREDYKKYSQTWKDLHPDYEYILWTDEDNLNLIKEQDPSFLNDYNSYNHYIKRADAARYYYMYKHGGIYADLDFECLRNFDILLDDNYAFDVIVGSCAEEVSQTPNALMISKPKANFWLHLICLMKERVNRGSPPYDTGPELLGEAIKTYKYKDGIKMVDAEVFYELMWEEHVSNGTVKHFSFQNYNEFEKLTTEQKLLNAPNSYAVSYWSASWKHVPDKNEKFTGITQRGIPSNSMTIKADKNPWV